MRPLNIMVAPRPSNTGTNIMVAPEASNRGNAVMVAPRGPSALFLKDGFTEARHTHKTTHHPVHHRKHPKPTPGPTPKPSNPNDLTFRGGAVLDKPVVSNIYLGDYWKTAAGQKDVQHNDAFSKDVVQSKYMSTLAQYGVGKGSFSGSTVVAGKPTRVTEAMVQKLVKAQIAAGATSKDPQAVHTVILPPGCVLDAGGGTTSKNGLGGFHGSYIDSNGKPVYYAVIAYSDTKGNGINFDGNSQDAVSITESHEWSEAFTDPDVNSKDSSRGLGWYNDANGEIGDEAISQLPLSQTYGKVDGYAVQKEWSNQDGKFEIQADNLSSPVTPPHAQV